MSILENRPALGIGIGTAALAGASVAGLLTLQLFGLLAPSAEADAPAPAAEAVLSTSPADTPAGTVLHAALTSAPSGWEKSGPLRRSVTAPFPYSCPSGGAAPVVSLSQGFDTGKGDIEVTVAAYTAGLGAEVMAAATANIHTCAAGTSSVSATALSGGPGTEAQQTWTGTGGNTAQVLSFRHGDVITHLTGNASAPLTGLAADFGKALRPDLAKVCADLDSGTADAARSPFTAHGFDGLIEDIPVTIPAVDRPDIPKKADYKETRLPAKLPGLDYAAPAATPDYPVWPLMPAPVERPVAPEAPNADPPVKTTVGVLLEDATGPGCGWTFTGMKAIVFDADAADERNDGLKADAVEQLTDRAAAWQKKVSSYWKAVPKYREAAEDYNDYAGDVSTVNAAWAATDAEWDAYRGLLEGWEGDKETRDEFLDEQDAARDAYEAAVEICEAGRPAPDEEDADGDTAEPTDANDEEPAEDEWPLDEEVDIIEDGTTGETTEEEPLEGCPAVMPDILEAEAPELGNKPEQPEDPRPEDAR